MGPTRTKRQFVASLLAYSAGLMSMASAIGYTLVGIKVVTDHFAGGEDLYWQNRLMASQLTGTTAFAFTGLMTLTGVLFWRSQDDGMRRAGTIIGATKP